MPVNACPGCGKQYKLPAATAAGQVAKCTACGKRFRLGPARVPVASAKAKQPQTKSAPTSRLPSSPPKSRRADPVAAVAASDAFWDDVLGDESTAKPTASANPAPAMHAAASPVSKPTSPHQQPSEGKPKKRKKKKIRWGFQWEKVIGGGVTFLIAGGITIGLIISTGYLFYWPAGVAVVGFFTMLSGLMGEEGIW